MKVIVRKTFSEASEVGAQILLGAMYQDRRVNISLAPGASVVETYAHVTRELAEHPDDFTNVHFYSFDNVDIDNHPDGLTGRDLREGFFDPAHVAESQIHLINVDNHQAFMDELDEDGGLDLMYIGLGPDGHFCGNMPGKTQFEERSYLIPAPEIFNESVGLLHLLDGSPIPEFAVTMGPPALLDTQFLVMIVHGEHKAQAVKRLVESDFDPMFPATALKSHPNFTVILDEAAASLL